MRLIRSCTLEIELKKKPNSNEMPSYHTQMNAALCTLLPNGSTAIDHYIDNTLVPCVHWSLFYLWKLQSSVRVLCVSRVSAFTWLLTSSVNNVAIHLHISAQWPRWDLGPKTINKNFVFRSTSEMFPMFPASCKMWYKKMIKLLSIEQMWSLNLLRLCAVKKAITPKRSILAY